MSETTPPPPEPKTLIEVLRGQAERIPEQEAYRFLLDGRERSVAWTYRELDVRARAIAARLAAAARGGGSRPGTSRPGTSGVGDRALLLYPPGLDFIAAFWGCLYQGAIAVPAYPPTSHRTLPRLLSILEDARPRVVLTTPEIIAQVQAQLAHVPALAHLTWIAAGGTSDGDETELGEEEAAAWVRPPEVDSDSIAFLQYTSGSTAAPKGVEVTHGNLLHNESMISQAFAHDAESVIVGWLPLYHDMGLIGNVLQPLYLGGRCILMSPLSFLKRPANWLEAISRYRATTSGGPNFAYELCARKIRPEDRAGLDLSSWKVAYNGAEPVRAATLDRFAEAFRECGFDRRAFYPCYGLAEATLLVTGGAAAAEPVPVTVDAEALSEHRVAASSSGDGGGPGATTLVGCGHAWGEQTVLIVDPETGEALGGDRVGEIWVAGASVARGYWRNPEESERTFRAHTAGGEGPFLRTGDLGFISPEGELVVTGRLKDLIILRGRNHYPQDIELSSETSHPALRPGCSAAFALEVEDEERLVVVQEVDRRYDGPAEPLIAAIRQAVAEHHQAQVHTVALIEAGSIPKTSSGKIQRRLTQKLLLGGKLPIVGSSEAGAATPEQAGSEELLAQLTALPPAERLAALASLPPAELEEALLTYLRQTAGAVTGLDARGIDLRTPLTRLGLDSLGAVRFTGRLEEDLGADVDLALLLQGASLGEVARAVGGQMMAKMAAAARGQLPAPAATARPKWGATAGPLTRGQRALWFLQRLAPESSAYNIVAALHIPSGLDVERLRGAVAALVAHHPALRTVFREEAEGPAQKVLDAGAGEAPFRVEEVAGRGEEEVRARVVEEAGTPFDLARETPLRVLVLDRGGRGHTLVLSLHHIVSDLWSLSVLLGQLRALYAQGLEHGEEILEASPITPVDLALAEERWLAGPGGEAAWAFWRERLAGELPTLDLATDRPRPPHQSFRGDSRTLRLPAELTGRLRQLAAGSGTGEPGSGRSGATLYTLLLAAWQTLLLRHSGQREILVGTPTLGRSRPELEAVVGYFVNPVVLHARLVPGASFADLVGELRGQVIGALVHQSFPFPLLVERLAPERDASRSPLFQAMFTLQRADRMDPGDLAAFVLGEGGVELDFGGLAARSLPTVQQIAQFDLELVAAEVGESLGFSLLYNTDLFDATTASRLLAQLRELLAGIVARPEAPLEALPLAGPAEAHQLRLEWNDTALAPRAGEAGEALVPELFAAQARRCPAATALALGGDTLDYRSLAAWSDRIAVALLAAGVGPETPVAVLAHRGFELVASMLALFRVGAAYLPLDPNHPAARMRQTVEGSGSPLALVTHELLPRWEEVAHPLAAAPRALDLDALVGMEDGSDTALAAWPRPAPDQLAYVLYTSGSTGVPKGAMVVHGGMLNHLLAKIEDLGIGPGDTVAQNASQTFDISIWQFLAALLVGGTVRIFPDDVAWDPARLPVEVAATGVTVFEAVPSMIRAMLGQLEALGAGAAPDFTALRWLIPTGEALPPEVARQWLERPERIPLVNAYGPTECSDDVTHAFLRLPPGEGVARMPIGRPIRATDLHVLDAHLRPGPLGAPGELWVGGRGVGRGYLGDPRRTADAFRPDPFGPLASPGGTGGARLYKTGDLVRHLPDGELEFFGRIDFQVKVRGYRIELEEIETVLHRHPGVDATVVVAREDALTGARLIAWWVPASGQAPPSVPALREWVGARLPEYMVPALFVELPALPLTANGKVDRAALPEPAAADLAGDGEVLAPTTPTEESLVAIWAEVLGLPPAGLGVDRGFFELGGHSLLATRVVSRIRESFGVELPLRTFFDHPTVAGLAARLEGMRADADVEIPRADPAAAPVVSSSQRRLWLLQRLDPASAAYNMPGLVHLAGPLDADRLERALAAVVRRHETLRTTFREEDGRPIAVITPEAPVHLERVDLTSRGEGVGEGAGEGVGDLTGELDRIVREESRRPFDLAAGPLVRTTLVRLGEERHTLIVNLHHIISDGWSQALIVRELSALYAALGAGEESPLPELPIAYRDYAAWRQAWLESDGAVAQLDYWRGALAGADPGLHVPTDFPRPPRWTYRGARRPIRLGADLAAGLAALGEERGVTPFMTLLTAWAALLSRLGGQKDLSIGTPVANRNHKAVEELVGFFVNTLVVRVDLDGDPDFDHLLARVREAALGAYAHQNLPFERLVEELRPERDLAANPLFQTLFVLQNAPFATFELPELTVTIDEVDNGTAKFDLTLSLEEVPGRGLEGWLEYSTDLYAEATIDRLLACFEHLLRGVVAEPEARLSHLSLLAPGERGQLVAAGVRAGIPALPSSTEPAETLHGIVLHRARLSPDAVAVSDRDGHLSYRALDLASGLLARRLVELGVGPETPVAIRGPRRGQLLVAMLGVLRAGGAYVPVDPAYPAERQAFMLEDSGARVLLTGGDLADGIVPDGVTVLPLDAAPPGGAGAGEGDLPLASVPPEAAAYSIYTSGSTGLPKGVVITHGNVAAMLAWAGESFADEELATVLAATSVCFDVSIFELFATLARGGRLVMVDNILALSELPGAEAVTLLCTVPSAMEELLRLGGLPPGLITVNMAGEALGRALTERIHAASRVRGVRNIYGPSEDTTYSTEAHVPSGVSAEPTIGVPLPGGEAHVLDGALEPVPVGFIGELYLAGAGVARGYAGRPALTAERFLPHPFAGSEGARLYRTGDLARRRADGELDFLGRADRQVKVRGFRIELAEVEACLAAHPGVERAVVLVRSGAGGDRYLAAYIVPAGSAPASGEPTPTALRAHAAEHLPASMIPAAWKLLPTLPLLPNGKVDLRALPDPERAGGEDPAGGRRPPRTQGEELLAGIFSELLGEAGFGIDENFFRLGGHSLLATQAVSRIRKLFGVDLPLSRFFENPTVAALAGAVDELRSVGSGRAGEPAIPTLPRGGDLPLSLAQERLWVMDRLSPGNPIYNVGQALCLRGPLDRTLLHRSFTLLARRHEILRTHFPVLRGEPRQRIADPESFEPDWQEVDLTFLAPEDREAAVEEFITLSAREPFALDAGVPLRLRLAVVGTVAGEQEAVLSISMHHILADDWSLGLLVRQLAGLYRDLHAGREPEPFVPGLQYADYGAWQRQRLAGPELATQIEFWKEHLGAGREDGKPPVLDLPTDRPRPPVQAFRGAVKPFRLDGALKAALEAVSRERGTTLFMSLLAAFGAVLSRAAATDDLVIGTPIANRHHLATEELVGVLVNVLPLRLDLGGEPTWDELLSRVRRTVLAGWEHQDVPFEKIVEAVEPPRDLSRAAVRQVALAFENHAIDRLELAGGVSIETLPADTGTARLDLTLFLWNAGDGLGGLLEYSTDLFEPATIDRFLAHFQTTLRSLAENPAGALPELPPLVDHPAPAAAVEKATPEDGTQRGTERASIASLVSEQQRIASNLTDSQLLFWFARALNPDVELYFDRASVTFSVDAELDAGHFEAALRQLVADTDSLRTIFQQERGVPRRVVLDTMPFDFEIVDLEGEAGGGEEAFQGWLDERLARQVDLAVRSFDTALVRLPGRRTIWYWSVHHLCADAGSIVAIADTLSRYYQLSQEGRLAEARPRPSYELWVEHVRELRQGPRWERARGYWEAKLATPVEPNLFYRRPATAAGTASRRLSVSLGRDKTARILELTRELSFFSPGVVFGTVLFAFLNRLGGRRHLRIGTPFANRRGEFADIIGLQMNACPLEVEIGDGETFQSLAQRLQRDTVETGRYQYYPVPNPPGSPHYDVYLNFQNVAFRSFCGHPVAYDLLDNGHTNDVLDLQVRDFAGIGDYTLDFDLNLASFDADEARRSVEHYLNLLDSFLSRPETPIHHAPLLAPSERRLLLEDFNDTATPHPTGVRLEELIEEQARKTPAAPAVVDEATTLDYRELDRRAEKLACLLRGHGVGPETFVGLAVERSVAMVVGLLGILKAGGAWVPLDPTYPPERLAYMLGDARVPVLLTQESLLETLAEHLPEGTATVCLDRDWPRIEEQSGGESVARAHRGGDGHTAYMIYTSGSTGRPKGTMVPHRGIVNRLYWMQEAYGLTPADRVLQKTPMSFDVSVWEFYWPLVTGACLVMARPEGHRDPLYLTRVIAEHGITTMHFVPSMLQAFLDQPGLGESCRSLVRVIASGEALSDALRRRFYELLGPTGARLHNLYGPTEASVDVTSWACPPEGELTVLPIGRPVSNTRLYILDRHEEPVPLGIAGELRIGGVQLARGYLRRPALSAERFVPDSLGSQAGERLYRTGDLARYLPNGDIEFLGRIDFQVKVRGFRIELGEIEAVVAAQSSVREVVVTAWQDPSGHTRLVAYLVPAARGEGEAAPTSTELRQHALEHLPDYMVPSAWVLLDAMPLSPSGKVDRRRLPDPDLGEQAAAAAGRFEAPRTALESLLASVFAEVLDLEEISIHANFFEVGGNSLMATQVVTLLLDVLPLSLELRNVFEAPTVAGIAAQIEEARPSLSEEDRTLMDEILEDFLRMNEGDDDPAQEELVS